MKERPILMNGEMVRATLRDINPKSQTRRIIEPAPMMVTANESRPWEGNPAILMQLMKSTGRKCKYGQLGDRLYVRETFALESTRDYEGETGINKPLGPVRWIGDAADGRYRFIPRYRASEPDTALMIAPNDNDDIGMRWTPSIHMPRWCSRILLEIVDVRVERLQDISAADAIAEGIYSDPAMNGMYTADGDSYTSHIDGEIRAFAALWESINGPRSWDANPWVWVVEFKRIENGVTA